MQGFMRLIIACALTVLLAVAAGAGFFGLFCALVGVKDDVDELEPVGGDGLQLLAEGKTMKQVAAELNITPRTVAFHKYQIMEDLKISRGNVNMNIRALCDWGLVHKELKPGDRKEYFVAEKDMTRVMKQIIRHRKQKELDPMIRMLNEISCVENECPDSQEFCQTIKELKLYTDKVDKIPHIASYFEGRLRINLI